MTQERPPRFPLRHKPEKLKTTDGHVEPSTGKEVEVSVVTTEGNWDGGNRKEKTEATEKDY